MLQVWPSGRLVVRNMYSCCEHVKGCTRAAPHIAWKGGVPQALCSCCQQAVASHQPMQPACWQSWRI